MGHAPMRRAAASACVVAWKALRCQVVTCVLCMPLTVAMAVQLLEARQVAVEVDVGLPMLRVTCQVASVCPKVRGQRARFAWRIFTQTT